MKSDPLNTQQYSWRCLGRWRILHKHIFSAEDILSAVVNHGATLRSVSGNSLIPIHIKAITGISVWQNIKDFFQQPRGRRAFRALCAFELMGLPAPEGIAIVEDRPGRFLRASYLVTRRLEESETLGEFVYRNFVLPRFQGKSIHVESLHRFIGTFADTLRRVHEAGIVHGDMKGENVLVTGNPGEPRVYFVDMDSIRLRKRVSLYRVAKNLAQLEASLPYCFHSLPRIRFFIRYIRGSPFCGKRGRLFKKAKALKEKRIGRAKRREERKYRERRAKVL